MHSNVHVWKWNTKSTSTRHTAYTTVVSIGSASVRHDSTRDLQKARPSGILNWLSLAECLTRMLLLGSGQQPRCVSLASGEVVSPSDSDFNQTMHLTYSDIRMDIHKNPRSSSTSKDVQNWPFPERGVSLLGRTICLVAAILDYMVESDGPFFRFADGRPLTRDRFVSAVQSAFSSAGYDCSYTSHRLFEGCCVPTHIIAAGTCCLCVWT